MGDDGRLRELREALIFGDPLDERARLDLLAILERAGPERRRGRPADKRLRLRAGIVGALVEKHGMPPKAALCAAAPDASEREWTNIERTYRAMRATGDTVHVPERLVREALRRK